MSGRSKPYPLYLDGLRYFCAMMLLVYGASKLLGAQFNTAPDVAQRPVGSLSGFTLTWFYCGYSTGYRWILGLTQVAGASLLLFRRTSLLGAMAMVPVVTNIVLINLFYTIAVGAEGMAVALLAALLCLIWHQRADLLRVLWSEQPSEPGSTRKIHWVVRGLTLVPVLIVALVLWARHR